MLILLSSLFLIGFVIGIIVYKTVDDDIGCIIGVSSGLLLGTSLLVLLIISAKLSFGLADYEKLEMYQRENNAIQAEIANIAEKYQDFEKEIFSDLKNESPVALVSLYPELKSNKLVEKQMNVYIENNKKIKEIREDIIYLSPMKWWVYFGW